uniref:Putative sugar ABC transporter, permease protein n=1 Tax=uncultured bacterium Contig394 TaxID=1393566 RepID=W0FTY0_9BACT|nr:putative sugar ABC transporter, permease protein [uncultured bacterium Contig394]
MTNKPSPWQIFVRRNGRTALYMFLGLLLAVVVLSPVLWMFLTSIMRPVDLTAKPLRLIPEAVTFERFQQVFASDNSSDPAYVFRIALINSFIIAAAVTLLSLVVGSLSAYAFAHVRFRGKNGLMLTILFTYMLPPAALIIPLYRIYNRFGWLDKRGPLIILYLSFIVPFIIWVMQDFFGSISRSFEEAAQVDGATRLQTLIYIFVPIARPGAIATGILAFLMSWDEFFYSLIFTSSLAAKTMPVAIAEFNGKFTIDYGMISVAGILGSLIPVAITVIFQKYIVMGMTAGGVKE